MRTTVVPVLLVGSLLGAAASHADTVAGGFSFAVPSGWVDLSPGAQVSTGANVPPKLLEQARSGRYAFYAADLAHGGDSFVENVNAVVRTGQNPPSITREYLADLQRLGASEIAKAGMRYQPIDAKVVLFGKISVGRMVGEITLANGLVIKMVQYSIPGDHAHAMLTYSSTVERFPEYEAIFDAAAQATKGVAPPAGSTDLLSERIGEFVGGALGVAAAVLLAKRIQRKRARSAQPSQRMAPPTLPPSV